MSVYTRFLPLVLFDVLSFFRQIPVFKKLTFCTFLLFDIILIVYIFQKTVLFDFL
jgi:hypothetical protein